MNAPLATLPATSRIFIRGRATSGRSEPSFAAKSTANVASLSFIFRNACVCPLFRVTPHPKFPYVKMSAAEYKLGGSEI
jgi:hypothetical protein